MQEPEKCQLCGRPLGGEISRHHLIPVSRGGAGTETIPLHRICHTKIHSVLNEKELERNYNTMEKIRANEEIEKFINWVRKKPVDFYDGSVKKKK
jgi:5-methylcytosine-specific restriction endonuclease McrA